MAKGELSGFAGTARIAGDLAAGAFLAIGAGALAVGTASVKMAADFQQSTNLLITSAGEIPANIDMIRQGLLAMSVDTATSTADLVTGMFNIESAGYHGADALMIEGTAARGAKVENADLASVTDVLTTAMHNYHEPASQAVDVMNSFRLSASMGKMHMDDLTQAMKNVLPIASQVHVHLTDVEAALSTMSLSGDKGASAGTHLSQMLTSLLSPTAKATKELKLVGLTTQQISDQMKVSLPGAIDLITKAVGEKFPPGSAKYIAALSAIVGGNKQLKAMLELSGGSLTDFIKNADLLGPTMKANSTQVDGWSVVQSNFNFKMDAAKNAVKALMIQLGTALLPVLGDILGKITPLVTGFMNWETKTHGIENAVKSAIPFFMTMFDTARNMLTPVVGIFLKFVDVLRQLVTWVQHNKLAMEAFKIIMIALGGLIAIMFTVMIIGAIVVLGALAIAIGIVVGVIMGVIWVFQHWGDIVGWLGDKWNKFVAWISGLIAGAVNWLEKPFKDAINNVVGWFNWLYNHNYYFKMLVDTIKMWISAGIVWLQGAWKNVVTFLSGIWASIVAKVGEMWSKISGFFVHAWSTYISKPLSDLWNRFTGWLNGWGPAALKAGQNFISMLVSGIKSGAGAIWDAVTGIAGNIWKALGFHSPTEDGPGKTADQWMPNLIKMMVSGLNAGVPSIKTAAHNVAAPLGQALAYPIVPNASHAPSSSSSGNQTFIFEINGVQFAKVMGESTDRVVRLKLAGNGRSAA